MSTKGSTKGTLTRDDISRVKQVIDKVEERPDAISFMQPVDYIGIIYLTKLLD
jgi:hypothetical protein